MPEVPEVEALREFLDVQLVGKEIVRVLPLTVNVLKTYDPPVSALEGATVTSVARHGKYLDIVAGDAGLHVAVHLARAGWLRWKDCSRPPRRGQARDRSPCGSSSARGTGSI